MNIGLGGEIKSKRKKVFVTGGSSVLIMAVVKQLTAQEFDIICLTRQNIEKELTGVTWHAGDLLKQETYAEILSSCDVILHAAAVTHTINEQEYYDVNLAGTKKLLSILKSNNKTRFIFISSRTATEESGAYGRSKLLAEMEIMESVKNWLILRPSEVFGGSKSEGIDKVIQNAMQGGIQLCPTGVNTPMYPIHVNDAARLIFQFGFVDEAKNKMIYINGPKPYSFSQLIKSVSGVTGKRVVIFPVPKVLLQLIAFLVRIFKVEIGMAPDQVSRLYSAKEHAPTTGNFITVEEFVKAKQA